MARVRPCDEIVRLPTVIYVCGRPTRDPGSKCHYRRRDRLKAPPHLAQPTPRVDPREAENGPPQLVPFSSEGSF